MISQGREAMAVQGKLLLEHLEGLPNELPARSNCGNMASEEFIAHYIEGEVREALGETRGCMGNPQMRIKKVWEHDNSPVMSCLLPSHARMAGRGGEQT